MTSAIEHISSHILIGRLESELRVKDWLKSNYNFACYLECFNTYCGLSSSAVYFLNVRTLLYVLWWIKCLFLNKYVTFLCSINIVF